MPLDKFNNLILGILGINQDYTYFKCVLIGFELMVLYLILNYIFTQEGVLCLIIKITNMW